MLRIISCVALIATTSGFARADSESPWLVEFDALDSTQQDEQPLMDAVAMQRDPLFDNAPFLHLRHGDKLVSAKRQSKELIQAYDLLSQGKYYQIVAREDHGKLLLDNDWFCREPLLFDWEFTLPHAEIFAQFEKGSDQDMSVKQYAEVYDKVRKRFPDMECRSPNSIDLPEDRILPIPGQSVAEFQGIAYNSTFNRVERYVLRIGPATCSMRVQILIQGHPRDVDRWEFDKEYVRKNNSNLGGNMTDYPEPDPQTAKIKRAEYMDMLTFQTIVLDVIAPNRVRSDEETGLR